MQHSRLLTLACSFVIAAAAIATGCDKKFSQPPPEGNTSAPSPPVNIVRCSDNMNTDFDDCPKGECDDGMLAKEKGKCDELYGNYDQMTDKQLCSAGKNANFYLKIEAKPEKEGFDIKNLVVDCRGGKAHKAWCKGTTHDTLDVKRIECIEQK